MKEVAIGVDIAKDSFEAAMVRQDKYQVGSFTNDADGFRRFLSWLTKRHAGGAWVGIEATGRYGQELALFLHDKGYQVSLLNPAQIKAYAASQLRRNKTDRQDARVIAHFCLTQELSRWAPPTAAQRELQALVRHLEALKMLRQQELNRLSTEPPSEVVVQSLQTHVAFLDRQIAELTERIRNHIDRNPDLHGDEELLRTIPGIGPLTAARFLAEVPDVRLFQRAAQLAAYAGLTPRQRQSGTSVRGRTHLSKTGNSRLRTALFMAALTALRHNPIVQAMAERLAARGKTRMQIVGAAMRKLIHLAYGVLITGRAFDPNYLQSAPSA